MRRAALVVAASLQHEGSLKHNTSRGQASAIHMWTDLAVPRLVFEPLVHGS
jgi:hypothetical protein